MITEKLIRYVVDRNQLVLTILLGDGTEIEVPINQEIAFVLGDDIMHGMYTGQSEEGHRIARISRIIDPESGQWVDSDDEVVFAQEEMS